MTSATRGGDAERRRLVDEGVDASRADPEAAAGSAALAALGRTRPPSVPEGAAERIEARIRAAWDEVFGI